MTLIITCEGNSHFVRLGLITTSIHGSRSVPLTAAIYSSRKAPRWCVPREGGTCLCVIIDYVQSCIHDGAKCLLRLAAGLKECVDGGE